MKTYRRWAMPLLALCVVFAGVTAITDEAGASGVTSSAGTARYVVARPECNHAVIGRFRCLAIRLDRVSRHYPGAVSESKNFTEARPTDETGPAGGYSPSAVASAYGVGPARATTQTVAIVDAYDDPDALSDLNTFDSEYGLPPETTASFMKVSQRGTTTDLPQPNASWAGEESLDLDAVRGLCNHCKIVLVEADNDTDTTLATAENEAAALGIKIISNSFGDPEDGPIPSSIASAFDHPGDVITAGAGDDGYFGFDQLNAGEPSADAPFFPASLSSVVAVGGTTLQLNSDGQRSSETVWNENGPADSYGSFLGPLGATGGGCSTQVSAPLWQKSTKGWTQTGCDTKRLSADVAALGDPFTGYDVYDSYQSNGWQTVGGTSLAAPLMAALWGLAGGPMGMTDPALVLYGHARVSATTSLYDITDGGSGYCGGLDATDCDEQAGQSPNTLGFGDVDCAFLPDSEQHAAGDRACDASAGYDGPSGVGSPHGLSAFVPLNPTARIGSPTTVTHNKAAVFTSAQSTDPYPGGRLSNLSWAWGDGTKTSGASPHHSYAKAGNYVITLTVTDNFGRSSKATQKLHVS